MTDRRKPRLLTAADINQNGEYYNDHNGTACLLGYCWCLDEPISRQVKRALEKEVYDRTGAWSVPRFNDNNPREVVADVWNTVMRKEGLVDAE